MLAVSGATNLYLRLKAESNKSSQSQGSMALLTQPLSPKACVCGGGGRRAGIAHSAGVQPGALGRLLEIATAVRTQSSQRLCSRFSSRLPPSPASDARVKCLRDVDAGVLQTVWVNVQQRGLTWSHSCVSALLQVELLSSTRGGYHLFLSGLTPWSIVFRASSDALNSSQKFMF